MKIHEYQAKDILRAENLPIPPGSVARTPEEAVAAAEKIGSYPVVVKAQVLVGGRGKAGGVKLAKNRDEVATHAKQIIGMNIKGSKVLVVLIEKGVDIDREIYAGLIMDRASRCPVLMLSAAGGVDIEEVAATTPEKILKIKLDPAIGLQAYQLRQAIYFLGIPKEAQKDFNRIIAALEKTMYRVDASLVEINPLVLTSKNEILVCDCKINIDDNALSLHPEIEAMRDESEEEPLEIEARKHSLSYVKLDGKIGCLVNGAGLAMGTMDIVKYYGGSPANFLDVGGGATPERIAEALQIVTSDPNVNTIFFNIFGGIVRCDRVAQGIIQARDQIGLNMPIVMRLAGTNQAEAHELLKDTDLMMFDTMAEAAQKAVELSKRDN